LPLGDRIRVIFSPFASLKVPEFSPNFFHEQKLLLSSGKKNKNKNKNRARG